MNIARRLFVFIADLFFLLVLLYTLSNTSLAVYGLAQAKGQLKLIWNAEAIESLVAKGKFTGEEKEKLLLIRAVREFSVDSLNYKPSNNYTSYYDQQGKPLLWIVTACEPYNMNAYEWKFPWLGKVSYKGYFDSIKAIAEYNRLKLERYDADISRVSAWSTLGWFKDPVFSEMLKKTKGDLTELIFHELFHGTIYARNSVDLNENLANFISWKATMKFFEKDTAVLNEYVRDYESDKEYNVFILHCSAQLDSAYKKMEQMKLQPVERDKTKMNLFLSFSKELEQRNFFSKRKTKRIQDRFFKAGNAYFMHFKRYDALKDSLEKVYLEKYNSNLGKMILGLRNEIESL